MASGIKTRIALVVLTLLLIFVLFAALIFYATTDFRKLARSRKHIKALAEACAAYMDAHTNHLPDSLEMLVEQGLLDDPSVLRSPFAPNEAIGFDLLLPSTNGPVGRSYAVTMLRQKGYSRSGRHYIAATDQRVKPIQATPYLKQKALEGDTKAAYEVGKRYYRGDCIDLDYEEAKSWFLLSARDRPAALNYLGCMFGMGEGVPHDEEVAVGYFKEAARRGNRVAMENLADHHRRGEGTPTNYAKAIHWYRKAIEAGRIGAMYELGRMHRFGWGVPVDYRTARRWFRRAAIRGNADAMAQLGWMHRKGQGFATNTREAIKWYTRAADAGEEDVAARVGWMYETAEGVPHDHARALHWYRRAAEGGDTWARGAVGRFYLYGITIPPDWEKAKEYLLNAEAEGDANAMAMLGELHLYGWTVPKDTAKARAYLARAAELRDKDSQSYRDTMELINRIDAGDDFTTYPTLFTYQDTEITNVTVHGEFNEWAAGYMEQDADGTWTRTLPLEAGTHAYKFVVNGTNWVMDPNTEETKVVDGYTNSAVIVPSAQETVTPQLPE